MYEKSEHGVQRPSSSSLCSNWFNPVVADTEEKPKPGGQTFTVISSHLSLFVFILYWPATQFMHLASSIVLPLFFNTLVLESET